MPLAALSQLSREEKANVYTHGLPFLFFAIILPIGLWQQHGSSLAILGGATFIATSLITYFCSTRYHMSLGTDKVRWRIYDHTSIYLLIAGSYTAYILNFYNSAEGISFLCVHWVIALIGIINKLWNTGKYEWLSLVSYIALGWMVVFIYKDITAGMNDDQINMLWLGGAFYSTGVIFYLWERLSYHHAIWHIFVFAGTLSHAMGLFLF